MFLFGTFSPNMIFDNYSFSFLQTILQLLFNNNYFKLNGQLMFKELNLDCLMQEFIDLSFSSACFSQLKKCNRYSFFCLCHRLNVSQVVCWRCSLPRSDSEIQAACKVQLSFGACSLHIHKGHGEGRVSRLCRVFKRTSMEAAYITSVFICFTLPNYMTPA